jgi:hypothetical protein
VQGGRELEGWQEYLCWRAIDGLFIHGIWEVWHNPAKVGQRVSTQYINHCKMIANVAESIVALNAIEASSDEELLKK